MDRELQLAAARGDVDTVRRLLEDGASWNTVILNIWDLSLKLQVHLCH